MPVPLRITAVLPSYPTVPFGGFKVVYEYANRLARRGHIVNLIHPRTIDPGSTALDRAKSWLWPAKIRATNRGYAPSWFPLDPGVTVEVARTLGGYEPPDADALIATAWPTAEWVAAQPMNKGRSFYFVQDYEYWAVADQPLRDRISATYRLGLRHIAISGVVRQMIEKCGGTCDAVLQSGIDHDTFREVRGPVERDPASVAFPLRAEPFKGTVDAIAAIDEAARTLARPIQAYAFGAVRCDVPEWVDVVRRPSDDDLRELLNSVSIFLLPSHYEGFGLTGLEAMACGAALVTADSGGVREYAVNDESAIVVPPGQPARLASALSTLVVDPERRARLARRGQLVAERFTWDAPVAAMERMLLGC